MMPFQRCLAIALGVSLLGACTWVKMEPEGQAIRVAGQGEDLSGCRRLGEIAVAVKDAVGLYRRDPLKVRDELEVMARNEAPRMQADTIQAVDEPINGEQRFLAFRCGQAALPTPTVSPATPPAAAARGGEAEVFPVKDD
jgi:hypothetical protein